MQHMIDEKNSSNIGDQKAAKQATWKLPKFKASCQTLSLSNKTSISISGHTNAAYAIEYLNSKKASMITQTAKCAPFSMGRVMAEILQVPDSVWNLCSGNRTSQHLGSGSYPNNAGCSNSCQLIIHIIHLLFTIFFSWIIQVAITPANS